MRRRRADKSLGMGLAINSIVAVARAGGNVAKKLGNYVQDLRLPKGFHRELRFMRMVRRFGGDGAYAVFLLWSWAAENCPTTGRLERMGVEDLHEVCCVRKDADGFIELLIEEEFLARGEDGIFYLPNWREEQPHVAQAEERQEASRAAANKRWGTRDSVERPGKQRVPNAGGNGSALGKQCPNTNSKTLKSPPPPPRGGESEHVPVSEIVARYREVLPELPEPREDAEKLGKDIAARWKSKPERQSLEWWGWFFALVREHPYLMGEVEQWRAGLAWLVCRANMDKVLGGHYLTRDQMGDPKRAQGEVVRETKSWSLEEYEQMRAERAREQAQDKSG